MKNDRTAKRTIYLSRSERRIGGRLFLRFSALNGLGISFLGDAAVTLLAIYFGAGNMELGIISAMIHVSGIFLLIVPRIFKGRNVVTVGFWAWMIRGLVGLPYGLLLFMEGRGAVALVMILYAVFCIARTMGVSMVTTIQKRLMVSRTQSDVVFRNAMSFQGTQMVSRFISFLILSLNTLAELTSLLLLPLLGIISNTAAALTLRRVPNRTRVDHQAGENLFVIFARSMARPERRRVLLLRWISLAQNIMLAMAIPFLRRSVGLDAAQIFLYTIAISMGAFLSSILLRSIAARAGSRPLMFYAAIPGVMFFLAWTTIPEQYSLAVYSIMGFFTMFALNATNLAANRLLISITPDDAAVGFNSMETFITSILALILGFGAGFLADLSYELSSVLPINQYGLVFLPAAVGSVFQVLIALRINETGSMGLLEAAKVIFNADNLRAWQTVNSLETTADPVRRKTLINTVGHSRAPVASSEIGKILAEPLSGMKGELIDAMFFTTRPKLAEFLRGEARDAASFHREKAIFALGAYPGRETEEVLKAVMEEEDTRMRAAAAKSLGRIGVKDRLEEVQVLWENEWRLRERLDYMIALFHMDPERRYIDRLFSPDVAASGERSQRTLFTLLSRQFGMSPPLGAIYREEAVSSGSGVEMILEEARDTRFLLQHEGMLVNLWQEGDYRRIWDLCHRALADADPPSTVAPVTRALKGFTPESADAANSLAALYFTYQLLTAEAAE